MKTTQKLEKYFDLVSGVRYDNENGPTYAYMQLLSYLREIQRLVAPVPHAEHLKDKMDAISWMLNEYLGSKFTPRHYSVFIEKTLDLQVLFDELLFLARRADPAHVDPYKSIHKLAA